VFSLAAEMVNNNGDVYRKPTAYSSKVIVAQDDNVTECKVFKTSPATASLTARGHFIELQFADC
jgi:hypothetical protein